MYHQNSNNLISAVRQGNLRRVREIFNSFGDDLPAWSEIYVLLRHAIMRKHTSITRLLLAYGCRVDSKTEGFISLLHLATNSDIEIFKMLLDRNADIHAEDQSGGTLLHSAVICRRMDIIELLLSRGADANAKRIDGTTPFHIAARLDLQIVECFLKHGVDINFTSTSWNRCTPLHFAVESGKEENVKLLLSRGADANSKRRDGTTSLHIAANEGYLEIVECLLKHGVDVNFVNGSIFKEDYTPLHLAIKNGHEKVVKLLLDYITNIDAQSKNGKTILHFAVEIGHSVIIEHILEHYPDVNNKSNKNAFNTAVLDYGEEYSKIVKNLLQYGFTINFRDVNNHKLLHAAVEKGYLKIVEDFLKYGTDVNIMLYDSKSRKGCMPLHVATINKQEEITKLLISCGADINAQDESGKNSISYAIENADSKITKLLLTNKANVKDNPKLLNIAVTNGCKEIVEDLLKHGVDVKDNPKLLNIAVTNNCKEIVEDLLKHGVDVKDDPEVLNIAVKKVCKDIVEELLKHGADVNTSDEYGRTALHFTVNERFPDKNSNINNDKEEIVKLLLNRGANINAQTTNGITALHSASQNGYVKVVEALLAYNADVNSTDFNIEITPLHFSAQEGNEIIIKMLLNKGANINAKQKDGTTALHIAVKKGHKEVVKILLESDADIDSKDEYGRTALHIASERGYIEIVTTLLKYGSDINIRSKSNHTPLDFTIASITSFYNKSSNSNSNDYFNDGRDIRVCESIVQILKRHMIKMKTANLYVRKESSYTILFISNDEISEFQNKCEKEIASIKSEKIHNTNVSFYDILTKNINQLAIYAGKEDIVQVLRSDDNKIKFPLYISMINNNFRKGEKRKELLKQSNKILNFFFNNFGLPPECTKKIFSYLSNEDLRILMDAYHINNINT